MNIPTPPYQESRIIRLPEVERRIGFKRSHIYHLMSVGLFPKTVRIGARAVGWDSSVIDHWIADRIDGQRWDQDRLVSGLLLPASKIHSSVIASL